MRPLTLILLLAGSLVLSGCDQKPLGDASWLPQFMFKSGFKNTDVTGLEYARDFALLDHTGKARMLADFRGKAVVVFFGYTQCPDVCPTTMSDLATVMQQLGPLADRVQVLFVTLDPERDNAEFLSRYVPAFDPRFLGLLGDKAATDKVAQEFRVFYQKIFCKSPHSIAVCASTCSLSIAEYDCLCSAAVFA